jgi:hypothetical protein
MSNIPVILVVALLLAGGVQAQTPAEAVDVTKVGPQVGEAVPVFSLADQNGRTWTRESIGGPKGAMVVFYRSASW